MRPYSILFLAPIILENPTFLITNYPLHHTVLHIYSTFIVIVRRKGEGGGGSDYFPPTLFYRLHFIFTMLKGWHSQYDLIYVES